MLLNACFRTKYNVPIENCRSTGAPAYRTLRQNFVGESRHNGATVWFMWCLVYVVYVSHRQRPGNINPVTACELMLVSPSNCRLQCH